MKRLRKALNNAFDEGSLELLIVDYFFPDTFAKLSPAGFGKNFEVRVQELINQAKMDDWLLDLVAAAREIRPRNTEIAAIAEELGLLVGGPRVDSPTGETLEALVQASAKFISPAAFRERLAFLEGQVCFIDIPGGHGGSGFLVAADLVLTNQHVIDPLTKGLARPQDVRCLFDYREPIGGTGLTKKTGTEVGLAAAWLVDSSPPSAFDFSPQLGDASANELDFAVVRLTEPVGEMPLGGRSTDPTVEPRRWIAFGNPAPTVAAGNQIFVLQHPDGEPLQLAIGKVTTFNGTGTRVRHDANSKSGSSGSPCFDADLQLVALHHAHDPAYPPAWNQAIPIASIEDDWRARGVVVG